LYRATSYRTLLEKGALVVSIDIDVGHQAVGTLNQGRNDRNVSSQLSEYALGKFEQDAIPLLANFLEEVQVPVTFAVRGQLLEVDATVLHLLQESSVKHDIAAHGYYHKDFHKLSGAEAEKELRMISQKMKENGVSPKTFVFPRNNVAHLELLEKYGYLCYRGRSGFAQDGIYIAKRGRLYDVHPSLFIDRNASVLLLKKLLDLSISKGAPFHLWFHPLDFGPNKGDVEKNLYQILYPFFKYATAKEKTGLLALHTMLSITKQLRRGVSD
jgi:peptidoglycan/xylan/chitin deacetylase (PgdA/CDA1 family)